MACFTKNCGERIEDSRWAPDTPYLYPLRLADHQSLSYYLRFLTLTFDFKHMTVMRVL